MYKIFHYFVEGQCEEKFINELKQTNPGLITAGKITVLNVVREKITKQRLMALNQNTHIVLVYDIDVENTHVLDENIKVLKKHKFNNIYHIQSIRNFEEELVYSTSLKTIHKMYDTVGMDEFKYNFIHQTNLYSKLVSINFDIKKIWSRVNHSEPFDKYSNEDDLKIIKEPRKK